MQNHAVFINECLLYSHTHYPCIPNLFSYCIKKKRDVSSMIHLQIMCVQSYTVYSTIYMPLLQRQTKSTCIFLYLWWEHKLLSFICIKACIRHASCITLHRCASQSSRLQITGDPGNHGRQITRCRELYRFLRSIPHEGFRS